jgi:hypothetical protein
MANPGPLQGETLRCLGDPSAAIPGTEGVYSLMFTCRFVDGVQRLVGATARDLVQGSALE